LVFFFFFFSFFFCFCGWIGCLVLRMDMLPNVFECFSVLDFRQGATWAWSWPLLKKKTWNPQYLLRKKNIVAISFYSFFLFFVSFLCVCEKLVSGWWNMEFVTYESCGSWTMLLLSWCVHSLCWIAWSWQLANLFLYKRKHLF
jgi:hypothetical protein